MAYDKAQLDTLEKSLLGQIQKPQGILGQLDPMKLALAQGFFAPTKTGGFGESVSNAVGALQGPLKTMADQNSSIQEKIMQIRLARSKLPGVDSEAREDRRDDRQRMHIDNQAIESEIRAVTLDRGRYDENTPEFNQRTAAIAQLRAQQAALTGRQAQQPQTAQPQQPAAVPPGTRNGEERTFRGGVVGVWNGSAWVPKGQ